MTPATPTRTNSRRQRSSVSESGPVLRIPELERAGIPLGLEDLTRHVLVTGSSGSGKTASVLLPILHALISHRQQSSPLTRGALLVSDPKRELLGHIECRPDRKRLMLHHLTRNGAPHLDYFARPGRSLLAPGQVVDELLRLNPAKLNPSRDAFWEQTARRYLVATMTLHLELAHEGVSELFWERLCANLRERARLSPAELQSLTAYTPPLERSAALLQLVTEGARPAAGPCLVERPSSVIEQTLRDVLPRFDSGILNSLATLASDTASCVCATIHSMIAPLISPALTAHLRLDPVAPGAGAAGCFSMWDVVRSGQLMFMQPDGNSVEGRIVGRAIKMAFFTAVLGGAAGERYSGFVSDEHHLVMSDDDTGESTYLDRARGFRGFCVLATQSIDSLRSAVREDRKEVVDVLVANTSTRFMFASTNARDIGLLQSVIPGPPVAGLPHISHVRSLARMKPGEAYWIRPGGFGVCQIELSPPVPSGVVGGNGGKR